MKRAKRTIGLSLVLLILTIPFITAQELNINHIFGRDKLDGYARSRDTLTVETLAKIPGEDTISRDQMRISIGDSYSLFDTCTKESNSSYFKCIFSQPGFEAYEPITFKIELRNDDDKPVLSKPAILQIDNFAPVVKQLNVTPLVTTGDVTITYKAEDYGTAFGNPDKCAGLKQITLLANNTLLVSENGKQTLCAKDGKFSTTLSASTTICAIATDFMNQNSAPKCIDVRVDKQPPQIETPAISDSRGLALTHLKTSEETAVTVSARITDDGKLDKKSVVANFGALGPKKDNLAPSTIQGDLFIWKNIPVTTPATCKISINAKDSLGNTANQDFPCNLRPDSVAPIVGDILADKKRGDKPLFGKNTLLRISFDEKDDTKQPGIGMNRRQAFLDLRSLSLGDFVQADTCSFTSNTWVCSWVLNPPNTVHEGEYTIKVVGTSDDLDNVVTDSKEFTIIYDHTPPTPPKIISYQLLQGSIASLKVPIADAFIQYTVRSSGFDTAVGNWADIGESDTLLPKVCADVDNSTTAEKDCEFEGQIKLQGPYNAALNFTFTDDAGNVASTFAELEVFGVENASNVNYWKSEIQCSPKLLNRATASIIPPYVTCRVQLSTKQKNIAPFIVSGPERVDQCSGDVSSLLDAYMSNNYAGSTTPYLNFKLAYQDYYQDNLTINCPIQVLTKKTTRGKTYVTPNAQQIPVNITLQFYNVPRADLYNDVDKQLKKALDDGLATQDWLGTVRKVLFYAEIACQIKTIITGIITTLVYVSSVIGVIGDVLKGLAITAPAGEAAKSSFTALCHTEETLSEGYKEFIGFLDGLCSIVNCSPATGGKDGLTGALAKGAGGVHWCNSVQKLFELMPGISNTPGAGDVIGSPAIGSKLAGAPVFNIKDSLIWSTVCLCLPGIVYNLEKLRQVQCYKATCLYDDVRNKGYPVSYCDETYNYYLCQYVIGQIFAAIPFSNFFNKIMDLVTTILSDPVALFSIALGFACLPMCNPEIPTGVFVGCATLKTISTLSESIASIVKMTTTKGFFSKPAGGQYCERMDDIKKEVEKSEQQRFQRESERAKKTNASTNATTPVVAAP